jgi:hypothetical protein
VDASTKALQCMAAVCSCLKYFGRVVIGVGRTEDRKIILKIVINYDMYFLVLLLVVRNIIIALKILIFFFKIK